MRHSSYILGGMELLTQHAETQKSNIYWTFVYIRRGRGMYLLDSDLRALNEGDIIFLPPKLAYSFCSLELGDEYNASVDAVVLRFDEAWLSALGSIFKSLDKVILKMRTYEDPYSVEGPKWMKMSTVLDGLSSGNPAREPALMIELLEMVSGERDLVRILKASPSEQVTLTQKMEMIDRYIENNVYGKVSLDDIAKYVGMNRTYFCLFFKKHYGKGFADYLNDIRVDKAASLLTDRDKKIAEIARECGFKTAPYFTRAFRRSRGMSPAEFRKKALNC